MCPVYQVDCQMMCVNGLGGVVCGWGGGGWVGRESREWLWAVRRDGEMWIREGLEGAWLGPDEALGRSLARSLGRIRKVMKVLGKVLGKPW